MNDNGDELGVDDGVFVFEFGDFKAVMVRDPDEFSGGYNLELNGTGSGTYDVQTIVFDGDGDLFVVCCRNLFIDRGCGLDC